MIIRFSQNGSLIFKTSRSRVVFVKNQIYHLKVHLLYVSGVVHNYVPKEARGRYIILYFYSII